MSDIDKAASKFLDEQDQLYGKNQSEPIFKSSKEDISHKLGKSTRMMQSSTISSANDTHWKNIPLENLPSRGLFYPDGTEITIKAATVMEVRQWSTMDEADRLDVEDTLNFIIEKCCQIRVPEQSAWLSWRDISELDRLALLFIIQEITFPDNQNSIFVKFTCNGACSTNDRWKDEVQITSNMLSFIEFPNEIMNYYNPEYKCFEINSKKLNETFYIYMPTIGAIEKLRIRITKARNDGRKIDPAFTSIAPYLIQDWSTFNQQAYYDLANENFAWHINKFTFVTKFVNLLEEARLSVVSTTCPKCSTLITAPLFSKSGFTIKDLFFISGGLDQLI